MYHKRKTDSIRFHIRCSIWKYNVHRTLKSSCLLPVRYHHYGKPPSFLSTYLHQYNFAVLDCYISPCVYQPSPLKLLYNKEKAKGKEIKICEIEFP